MRSTFQAFALACVVVLAPEGAVAGTGALISQAEEELDRLEFEQARKTVARARHLGDGTPRQIAEIYRLSGIIAGSYGNPDAAKAHFARWLALDPDASLDPGVSPRISEPFAEAQDAMREREPLRVEGLGLEDDRAVALVVQADPLGMVAGAMARFETPSGERRRVRRSGESPYVLPLPQGLSNVVTVVALDRHGNHLAELSWRPEQPAPADEADSAPDTPPVKDEQTSRRPFYAQWYLWGGVASGLAASGAYFGLRAQSDGRAHRALIDGGADPDGDEAQALGSQRRRHVRLGTAAGVGAAAAASAALVLIVTRPGGDDDADSASSGARAFAWPLAADGARGGAAGVELSF